MAYPTRYEVHCNFEDKTIDFLQIPVLSIPVFGAMRLDWLTKRTAFNRARKHREQNGVLDKDGTYHTHSVFIFRRLNNGKVEGVSR